MLLSVKGVGQVNSVSLTTNTICYGDNSLAALKINSLSDVWVFVEQNDPILGWIKTNLNRFQVKAGIEKDFSFLDFYQTLTYRINYANNQFDILAAGTTYLTQQPTLTVNALPTAGTPIGVSEVCVGNTITLSPNATGGSSSYSSYSWSSSATSKGTIGASTGVVTGVAGGSTNITYTVTDSKGCVSPVSTSYAFTINALPIAGDITGTNEVCVGLTTTLTSHPSGGSGTYSSTLWTSSATSKGTIGASTGVVTGVAGGSTNISYTVTDSKGCISPSSAAFSVTINALPSIISEVSNSDIATCLNVAPNFLTVTANAGSGTISKYEWYSNTLSSNTGGTKVVTSASSLTTDNFTPIYTIVGDLYYYPVVTNSNGCSTNGSISGKITVNPLPTAGTITGTNEVCVGSTTTLSGGTMTGGSGTYSSTIWSSSASSNATVSATGVVTGVAGGSTNVSYTVTDSKGCISPSSAAFSVTVNAVPIINSLSDTTKVCGTKTILDAGAGYTSYSWSNGATSRYISTDVSQNYFVTVTNASSCSSMDSTYLSIIDPKLYNNDTTILSGGSVNLNAHGILNSADKTVLYDFSNVNALSSFTTLTTNGGTITTTSSGQTGNGVELVRANNCCSDAELKTIREDFSYGTYEVDAYSASGVADQSFGIMEQSGSWVNRVLNIGTRPSGTDNPGWEIYFKGVKLTESNTSPVNNNTWYKIKVYITPSNLKIWLNSTVIFDGALPSAITNPRGAIRVGAYDISRYDNISYTPYQVLSYLWSTSSTNQNISVTPNVTTTYQLKVTDQTTTCNTSVDIRVLKINILNNDASICNNTTQDLYIDSTFSKYNSWQTKKPGIEFYNIKKDLNGNLYALPSLNNQKIFKSIDRGETWNQMSGFPNVGGNNFMALGVDQNNVIYASTNDNGIYKSLDEGVSWQQVKDFGGGCGPMDILFGSNYSVVTVKGYNRGIWSSSGDLINWQQKVINFDPNTVTKDINGNIYSGGDGYDGKVLFKSSDAGTTWSKISSAYAVQIIRADSNGKVFFTEGNTKPLYVSNNQGGSFSLINSLSLPNSGVSYPEDIAFTKNIMFITKGQVYYSKDNGTNFSQLGKLTFPTAGGFNYGPGGAPYGNYGDSSNRMEIIGNRLFVASLDGIKFIDIDNLNTTVTWSTGEVGNKITVTPVATSPGYTSTYSATVSYGSLSGSDQVTFTLPTKPTITASGPTTFCQGGTISLTANSIPAGVYSYTWQTGANTQSINVTNSGSYSVTTVNSIGCVETSTPIIVTVNPTPAAPTVTSNSPIEEGNNLMLTASNITGATYAWTGPNSFISNQQNPNIIGVTLASAGNYYAVVTLNGCSSVNSLPVNVVVNAKVISSPVFQIPNAFTPNNDGHNDTFKILQNGYVSSIVSFKIFTKSGKLIFSDKEGAWDGRFGGVMLDADVYIWIADIINKNNIQEHLTGTVLLLK